MNIWTLKSFEKAKENDYIDQLFEHIYKVELNTRSLKEKQKKTIREEFQKEHILIDFLLNLKKFPIDHPYLGLLRKKKKASTDALSYLLENPKVTKSIYKQIHKEFSNASQLVDGCERTASPSRQLGQSFHKFINDNHKLFGFKMCKSVDDFKASDVDSILYLNDKKLQEFANTELGLSLGKGIDLVVKIKSKYVIGEAKFFSNHGGSQNNQFTSMLDVVDYKTKHSTCPECIEFIGIADGAIYEKNKTKIYKHMVNSEYKGIILSALLLKEYFESLRE